MGIGPSIPEELSSAFSLDAHSVISPIQTGLINTSYLAASTSGNFILQKINENVFDSNAVMDNTLQLLKSYRSSPSIKFYRDHKSQLWKCSEFLEANSYDFATNNQIAFEAGKTLANFHEEIKDEKPAQYQIHLNGFNDLHHRYQQLQQTLNSGNQQRINDSKKHIELINQFYSYCQIDPKELPVRVCHNDTKLNNIILSKTDQGICLIDLDTIMPGYLLYDFGDLFRTTAYDAKEGELELDKIQLNAAKASSVIKGFFSQGLELSKKEQHSLTIGAVYMPLIHSIRAFIDYFLGDVYYKVSYSEQNLDRATSLLQFAKEAYEKRAFIDQQIKHYNKCR